MEDLIRLEAGYVFLVALYYVFVVYPVLVWRRRRQHRRATAAVARAIANVAPEHLRTT